MEVQFSDAREFAAQFGEVISLTESDNDANNVDVLVIVGGRETVGTVSYDGENLTICY